MTHTLTIVLSLSLAALAPACGGEKSASGQSAAVDFSKPDAVLETVFNAARTGDVSQLAGLCAPDADKDARRICDGKADSPDFTSFKEHFAKGRAVGTQIDGNTAKVDFLFGPDGTRNETMTMALVDGKWLLQSF